MFSLPWNPPISQSRLRNPFFLTPSTLLFSIVYSHKLHSSWANVLLSAQRFFGTRSPHVAVLLQNSSQTLRESQHIQPFGYKGRSPSIESSVRYRACGSCRESTVLVGELVPNSQGSPRWLRCSVSPSARLNYEEDFELKEGRLCEMTLSDSDFAGGDCFSLRVIAGWILLSSSFRRSDKDDPHIQCF